MKPRRFHLPASIVLTLASVAGTIQAQIIFDWKDTAPDSNWSQGAAGPRWWDNTNLTDLWDAPGVGILRFNNNHELNMTNNVSGTYDTHGIVFGSDNTGIRTLAGGTVRLFDSSGADPFIRNDSSATHVLDLNLEGDGDAADPLKIEVNGSGGLTFNGSINKQGSWIDVVGSTTSAATVSLNGAVSGAGGLYKDNANTTLILTATNSYTGGTQVNSGVLQIGNGGASGNFGTGSMSIGGSGILAFNRSGSFNLGGITSSAGAKVQVNLGTVVGTATTSFGSLTTGNLVEVANGGAIDLSGVNRDSNRLNLSIAGTGVDGAGGVGAITNSGGDIYADAGILNMTLTGNAEVGGNNGRFDIGRSGATSGTITGNNFTLTKVGSNQLVARGAATNITYVVNAGSLIFEDFDSASGTNPITVNGGTLGTWGARTLPNDVTFTTSGATLVSQSNTGRWTGAIALNGAATFNASGTLVIEGSLAGTGNITRSGGGTLILQNTAASYSGKFSNPSGTLRIQGNAALGTATGADVLTLGAGSTLQGGTLAGQASAVIGSATQGISHSGSGTFFYNAGSGNTLTIAGSVTGGVSTIATQNGTVAFSNAVTLSDPSNALGNLVVRNNSKASFLSGANVNVRQIRLGENGQGTSSNMDIAAGATVTTTAFITGDGGSVSSVITHSGGTLNVTGTNNSNGTGASILFGHWGGGTTNYNLSGGSFNASATLLSLGWDTAGANFNVSGGTANLLGINLGNGRNNAASVNLTGGRINLGASGINTASNKSVNLGGGTVGAFANWSSSQPVVITGTNGNTIFNTLDSVDGVTARTITLGGVVSGSGNITKTGAGILALSNTGNTFSGKYNVTGGTVSVGADSHFGAVPGTVVADSFTLNSSTLRLTAGMTLNANRGITIASGATINTNSVGTSNNATIASIIAGSGGLTLAANGDTSATGGSVGGSLQLSGANTFTGNVRITSGLVDANANFGNAANVIILDGGGLVDKNLNTNFTRNIQIGAGGGVLRAYGSVSNNIYAGSISNETGVLSTTLRRTDGGLVKLAGDGSGFTGTFTNQRGSLQITANNANWANTDFVQDTNGSTITFNGGGTASIRSLTSTRDVLVQNGMTLNIGGGGITMATNSHWWQTNSGTVGNLTSSTGTLTVTNGAASGNLGTLDHQIRLKIINDGANPVTLVKNNVNSLVLNQANTYSGGTTIHGGRISADHLSAFGTGMVTVNSSSQAYLTQAGTYTNAFTIAGNGITEGGGTFGAIRFQNNTVSGNITVAASGARIAALSGNTGTHSGSLLGTGNLEINGGGATGTISLTGSNAGYGGTVTVSSGRLNMGSTLGGAVVVADAATLGNEGTITGNLTLGATTGAGLVIDPSTTGRLTTGGNLILNGVTNLTFSNLVGAPGPIAIASYSGSLTDGNGGNLSDSFSVPNPTNYRTAIVTDNAKTLELDLGNQNTIWTGITSSTWELQGAAANWTSTDNLFFELDAVTFDDSATNKTVVISGAVGPNWTNFTNSTGNNYAVSGSGIGGIGGLTKSNSGVVTFTSNNTFTGAVNIQGGSLIIGNGGTSGTLGGTGDINVATGASLAYDRSDTVNIGRRAVGGGTLVQNGSGTLRTGQAGNNVDITVNAGTFQAIEGGWATSYFASANRQIVINNGGTLLTSTHSLGGLGGTYHRPDMTISTGGTWQLSGEQYMNAGDLTLNGGTILITGSDLRMQGGTMAVGASAAGSVISRTGGSSVTLYDSPTFNVADGMASADLAISAPIGQNGTRGITKTGLGTMNLDAASTYTGATAVNAGRINVNGSITSATNIAADAFLGGDGTVTGAVNLTGTLLPGQGGTTDRSLTINGNVTTSAGALISFTVDAMNDHDKLIITGANSIGLANTDLDITFDNALTFTNLDAGEGADFLAAISSTDFTSIGATWFRLIEGNTTGMFANVTDTLTSGELAMLGLSGTQYAYNADNGQRFWVAEGSTYLVAIPEPRAAFLGGIGILILLRRRRH